LSKKRKKEKSHLKQHKYNDERTVSRDQNNNSNNRIVTFKPRDIEVRISGKEHENKQAVHKEPSTETSNEDEVQLHQIRTTIFFREVEMSRGISRLPIILLHNKYFLSILHIVYLIVYFY
jgi:hypothetical protein